MGVLSKNVDRAEITLRTVVVADADALAQLGKDTFIEKFGHLYGADDLAEYLAKSYDPALHRVDVKDDSLYHLVAEQGGAMVGFAKAGPCKLPVDMEGERAYELQRLYVRAGLQGQGLGARLMHEVLRQARRKNYDTIYLGVWENNEAAQRFYAWFGFVEVAEYTFFVGRQADRELIFRLKL